MWKKILFFIPSIDRVCGTDAQVDFLHGSVRRYKTLRSSTNLWVWPFDDALCGNCNHATVHSGSIYTARWGALLIVVPAPGAAVTPLQAARTSE